MKSYLTVRGIEFDSIDVTADPAGFDRLVSLGAKTTPVVAIGDRWIGGSAFDRVKEFIRTEGASAVSSPRDEPPGAAVGNMFSEEEPGLILDEAELISRLDSLLSKAIVYAGELPDQLLRQPLPVRGEEGRTVAGLVVHISQVAQDPLRAAERIPIVKEMHHYDVSADVRTSKDLANQVELVRDRLRIWSGRAELNEDHDVDYFQGPYTFHGLLERCAWHVATHVRQLAWILVDAGVNPNAALTTADSRGLPIPPAIWK